MEKQDLKNRFTYHAPKAGQPEIYQKIREQAKVTAFLFNELCPDSREKSLAMTKLEEAVMWANAAIARNGEAVVPSEPSTVAGQENRGLTGF